MRNVRKMVLCSLFASLCAVCSWIAIPMPPIYITLQTFAILLTLGTLGGRLGFASVVLYLLLGMAGLPVFAGFRSGIGALLDVTGGFLWGFPIAALVYWALERLGRLPAMAAAQITCYGCGCWWFSKYAPDSGFGAAILVCVLPYLIPDGIKLWLAYNMSHRLHKHLPK